MWIAVALAAGVLSLVGLLAVPVDLRFRVEARDRIESRLRVEWLFGWLGHDIERSPSPSL